MKIEKSAFIGLLTLSCLALACCGAPISAESASTPINAALSPTTGSVSTGSAYVIQASYSDGDGVGDIGQAFLMVNHSLAFNRSFDLRYDMQQNLLYVRNDANSVWKGGFTPGSQNAIDNGQGILNCAGSSVLRSGNFVTVTWSFTPKPGFTGDMNLYMHATDNESNSAIWKDMGDLTINGPSNTPPVTVSVNPSSGSSATGIVRHLTAVYSDADGAGDLGEVFLMANSALSFSQSLDLRYNLAQNKLYVRTDADNGWKGGYAPGSWRTIDNGQGSLNCADTTVTRNSNQLTVTWSIVPKAGFLGLKNIYLHATDKAGATAVWSNLGNWNIVDGDSAPSNGPLNPASGSSVAGVARTLTTVTHDVNGSSDLSTASILINSTQSSAHALYARYDKVNNLLYLYNDAGTNVLTGFAPGSGNTITNSQGTLNCAATTVSSSGNTLTVNWSFTPSNSFAGSRNVYLYATDIHGAVAPWQTSGTWTITQSAALRAAPVAPSGQAF